MQNEFIALSIFSLVFALGASWQLARVVRKYRQAKAACATTLRHENERFRWVFENAMIPMQVFSPTGKLVSANRAWFDLTLQEETALDSIRADYNVFADAYLESVGLGDILEAAFLRGESGTSKPFAWDAHGRQSNQRWFQLVARPLANENGDVREILLRFVDVSEQITARPVPPSPADKRRAFWFEGSSTGPSITRATAAKIPVPLPSPSFNSVASKILETFRCPVHPGGNNAKASVALSTRSYDTS